MDLLADKADLGWKASLHKWDLGLGGVRAHNVVQSQPPGKGGQIRSYLEVT